MTAFRYGFASLRLRPVLALLAWSIPETLPAALVGLAIARAVDRGFLAGRPEIGLLWLSAITVASLVSAIGARQVLRWLAELVEPVRDDLIKRVVAGAIHNGVAGRPPDGAVARLGRQVEMVRDSYAGLIVVSRGFLIALAGTTAGLLSLAPVLLLLIMPPVLAGIAAFLFTLRLAAARQRACVLAEEDLAATTSAVLSGARDVVASGGEEPARELAAESAERQAAAERRLAMAAVLRSVCFAVAAWVPLIIVLAAGPWLIRRGLSAGEIMGSLTYVLFGLQPAVSKLMSGLGGGGLRYAVTLNRILEASRHPASQQLARGDNGALRLRGVTFAYGEHSEPVLKNLSLLVPDGSHLAIIGPSGIGKSTLASILCGLTTPGSGTVSIGGQCALIPQEAYVFSGTVRENLCYLNPGATDAEITAAAKAIGAGALVAGLGGLAAPLSPTALSPGERQLVSLTRAYLSPATIAVLDEATCHLDPAAERQAEEAFAARGGTLIVIAHRASSALRAPRVLVLDGVTAADGTHPALSATSELYRQLLGRQAVSAGSAPMRIGHANSLSE
jgi:ATP-binding cassette subfamily C protein